MTPAKWDAHKREWCDSCGFARRCAVKAMLDKDPADEWAQGVMKRLGHCSQYKAQIRKTKTKKKRG